MRGKVGKGILLVLLLGGVIALRDLDRLRAMPPEAGVPLFTPLVRWPTVVGVIGSLRAKRIHRRYGQLAIAPWPALVASTFAVRAVNDAFAAPSEDLQCMVVRTFSYQGRMGLTSSPPRTG